MKSRGSSKIEKDFEDKNIATSQVFCDKFLKGKPGIEAVLLSGSVARGDCTPGGYGYSVDLCILITGHSIDSLVNSFDIVREGRFLNLEFDGVPFTLEPLALSYVFPYNPEASSKYYAIQESRILYDREGVAAKLMEMKMPEDELQKKVVSYYYRAIYHMNNYRVEKWICKKEFSQCHHNLNTSLELLFKLIYLANHSFIPREDCLVYYLDSLSWLPERVMEKISQASLIKKMALADILRRRTHLVTLLNEIKQKLDIDKMDIVEHQESLAKVASNFRDSELT